MSNQIELTNRSKSIIYLKEKDKRLAKLIDMIGPIKYNLYDDHYSFLVHEIIEQMLSIKVGNVLYNRLLELCENNMIPENVIKLSVEQLRSLGISYSKSQYILNLTNSVLHNEINFEELKDLDDKKVMNKLKKVKGIGDWTAKMYLIFVLDRQDILPTGDTTFIQSYKWLYNTDKIKEIEIIKKCKKWKPYSSIASRYLYNAFDNGLTKEKFHLYKD